MPMRTNFLIFPLKFALVFLIALSPVAQKASTLIQEPFDYGTVYLSEPSDLDELGEAGNGWSGPWEIGRGQDTSPAGLPQYASEHEGKNLNRELWADGYASEANHGQTGSVRTHQEGGNPAAIAVREFTDPLSAKFWISFVAMTPEVAGDALLWLGSTTADARGNEILLGLRSQAAFLRTGGEDFQKTIDDPAGLHLILTLIRTEPGTGESAVEVWVDPDVSQGESSLGDPALRSAPGVAFFQAGVPGVGISLNSNGSSIDDMRISDDLILLLQGELP